VQDHGKGKKMATMTIKEALIKFAPPQNTSHLYKTIMITVLGWFKVTNSDNSTTPITDLPVPANLVTLMEKVSTSGFYEKLSEKLNTVAGEILDKLNEVDNGQILTVNKQTAT
jgi:hypothetical protein